MNIIDPHLHLFDLQRGEYGWLRKDNPPNWPDKAQICKNVSASDLVISEPNSITGFVHIEAGFDNARPWREVDWLMETVSLPFRSVAGISLLDDTFDSTLVELIKRPCVVGVRDILDDEAVVVLSSRLCQERLAKLAEHGLSFDAQLSMADLAASSLLIQTVRNIPELMVILNHSGWPPNDPYQYQTWVNAMKELAELDNVAVKLSGWEMSDRNWCFENAMRTINKVIALFGEERVMLASNFPLSTWRYSYDEYWSNWIAQLSADMGASVTDKLFCQNAYRWYKFFQK